MPAGAIRTMTVGALAFGLVVPAYAQTRAESHRFAASDGAELHYLEAGTGPLIVFVPGWTMPADIWQPQIDHFAASYRVVAFDPRGQGRSEKVSYGYYAERRARDIGELLVHLGGEPAILVGWSLGVHAIMIGNLILMDTGDLTAAVEALDKPALFVWIDGRPEEWREAVLRYKPDAEIVVVADAGHTLFVDQPQRFNEAVERFIEKLVSR